MKPSGQGSQAARDFPAGDIGQPDNMAAADEGQDPQGGIGCRRGREPGGEIGQRPAQRHEDGAEPIALVVPVVEQDRRRQRDPGERPRPAGGREEAGSGPQDQGETGQEHDEPGREHVLDGGVA